MAVTRQAPLSMGFSRQEYWSGLPCPHPGDLPDPGIEPVSFMSPAQTGGFLATSSTCEALPSLGEDSDVTQSRNGPRSQIPQTRTALLKNMLRPSLRLHGKECCDRLVTLDITVYVP